MPFTARREGHAKGKKANGRQFFHHYRAVMFRMTTFYKNSLSKPELPVSLVEKTAYKTHIQPLSKVIVKPGPRPHLGSVLSLNVFQIFKIKSNFSSKKERDKKLVFSVLIFF